MPIPQLSYSVTRNYPWPLFTPLAIALASVSLLILVPLNGNFPPSIESTVSDASLKVALTGYQVIPTLSRDYDATDPQWWNRFGAHNKPGSLCDPQFFSPGNVLSTTYSLFPWTVVSPNIKDPSASSFPYRGTNLDSCDIYSMGVDADVNVPTVNVYATVMCTSQDVPLLLRTSWTGWGASSSYDQQVALLLLKQPDIAYPTEGSIGGINAVNEM